MANLLKMAIRETIRALRRQGLSRRRIAEELGINRETVARYLRLAQPDPKPAIAPIGSQQADDATKPAIAPIGSAALDDASDPAVAPTASDTLPPSRGSGRISGCEPWRCHGALQNQPLVGASKPATILTGFGHVG